MADLEVWEKFAAAKPKAGRQRENKATGPSLLARNRTSAFQSFRSTCRWSRVTLFSGFLLWPFSLLQSRRLRNHRTNRTRHRLLYNLLPGTKAWISRLGRAGSSHFHLMDNPFFAHLRAESCSRANLFFAPPLICFCLVLGHRSQRQTNRQSQSNWRIDGGTSCVPTASKEMHSQCELTFQIRVRNGLMSCRFA